MKTLSLIIMALVIFAASSVYGETMFGNLSTAGGTVYSEPIKVGEFRVKTIQVNGATMSTHAAAALSGTFLLQCGMNYTGPWLTCKDAFNASVSTTSNAIFTLQDQIMYVRGSWAKTSGEVNAWINYK